MEFKGNVFKAAALASTSFSSKPKADIHINVNDETDGLGVRAEISGNVSGVFTAVTTLIFQVVEKFDCSLTLDDILLAVRLYGDMKEGQVKEIDNVMKMVKAIDGDDKQGNG